MLRYLAFIWNDRDSQQRIAAERLRQLIGRNAVWHAAISAPGLAIVHTACESQAHLLGDDGAAGVVLGTLFERPASDHDVAAVQIGSLSPEERQLISRSNSRRLLEKYWGRYVGIMRDPATSDCYALRDPSGLLPCYHCVVNGVHVLFSSLPDLLQLGVHFPINWDYVRTYLLSFGLHECRDTGLIGISTLLPGECLRIRNEQCTWQQHWNALQISQEERIEDRSEAISQLRSVTRMCVQSWAADRNHVLHKLSGGLDSSIVLACLQAATGRKRLTCFNQYSSGSGADERHYARLAADRAGCTLIECERDPQASWRAIQEAHPSACPTVFLQSIVSRAEIDTARAIGADAIFSGEIGDAIFYTPTVEPAADFVRAHGIAPGLMRVAASVARANDLSVWQVLGNALRRPNRSRDRTAGIPKLGKHKSFLNLPMFDGVQPERFVHPWLAAAKNVPPGKLEHMRMMLFVPSAGYDPLARTGDPDRIPPLVSQPLMEVALRIPTYVLVDGGWDRSIARRAFFADLPWQIATRRTKGDVDVFLKQNFLHNLDFLAEYLLDGVLAREQLIDARQVRKALAGSASAIHSPIAEWHCYLFTEAWLRSVTSFVGAKAA